MQPFYREALRIASVLQAASQTLCLAVWVLITRFRSVDSRREAAVQRATLDGAARGRGNQRA